MSIEIIFSKEINIKWEEISGYRDFFTKIFNNITDFNKEKIDIIVMIISELLENVVKYTSNHVSFLKIYFERDVINGNYLHIILENDRNSQSENDYKNLLKIVSEINSYEDYEQMYLDFAQKFLENPDGKSQFGMALIRKLTGGSKIIVGEGSYFVPGTQIKLCAAL